MLRRRRQLIRRRSAVQPAEFMGCQPIWLARIDCRSAARGVSGIFFEFLAGFGQRDAVVLWSFARSTTP
jgi:hypothetical protein